MLEVRPVPQHRFSAASGAVAVTFFTLFGFIFLITQYFQFVRGYGPLSTGVRLLPVAILVGAGSVAGTELAVRAGAKLVVTTGLVAMAAFYAWVAATISATLAYGIIAAQMVVYGLGLGLTSAPATESIMGAISRGQGRCGLGHQRLHRLVGGTLGVAVIGSVYASVYTSRLTGTMPTAMPARSRPSHTSPSAPRRRRRQDRGPRPSGPGTGAASRLHQRLPARPSHRRARRRQRRRIGGRSWPYCSCPLSQRP